MFKIIFLASIFFISSCAVFDLTNLKNPEVKILDFKVVQFNTDSVSVNLKLNVINPNSVPLKLSQVGYNLKLSGLEVTDGVSDQGIDIPASGTSDVIIPLNFKYNAVGSLVDSFLKKTITNDYEITGSAKVGFFSIPFNKKGEINFKK